MNTFVETLLATANDVSARVPARSKTKVYLHLLSELGEIGEEANIACGELYKPQGKDGLLGEAADVINCIADLLWVCTEDAGHMETIRAQVAGLALDGVAFAKASDWPASLDEAREIFALTTDQLPLLRQMMEHPSHPKMKIHQIAVARLIYAVLALANAENPGLTEDAFLDVFRAKCDKWLAKATGASAPTQAEASTASTQYARHSLADFRRPVTTAEIEGVLRKARGKRMPAGLMSSDQLVAHTIAVELGINEGIAHDAFLKHEKDSAALAGALSDWIANVHDYYHWSAICEAMVQRTETAENDEAWRQYYDKALRRLFGAPKGLGAAAMETSTQPGKRWSASVAHASVSALRVHGILAC